MNDLKICRICLSEGVKMYDINQYNLKRYYEGVMGKKMNENDGLPLYFCFECAAGLLKFHKFKEKCYTGEKVLQKMKLTGPITLSSISLVQRQNKDLQSTISTIVRSRRIKTCVVKHKSVSKTVVKQNKKDEIPEIKEHTSSSSRHYGSMDPLEGKNLAEMGNEIDNVNVGSIKHTDITEKEKVNIRTENVKVDGKAAPQSEDDRMFSDDEEFNKKSTNDEKQPAIQEDNNGLIIIEEEINDNVKKEINKKQKNEKATAEEKDKIVNKKETDKKFVPDTSTYNYLDPKHWLKINLSEEEALKEFNVKAEDKKYLSAAYRCTDCYKSFSKEDMMNRHFKLRHFESLGPLECRFCKMRFKVKWQLTKHLTHHFTKYKCLRCEIICPLLTTAIFHNGYHNGVIKQCNYCGAEFRHPSTYYTHLRTHRSEHVCTLCGASFVSVAGLHMHKKTMHVDATLNLEEEENIYCERCDIKLETRKAYEEHMFHSAKHTEGVEHLAGETPGPSIPKRIKQHKAPRIRTPCNICNETFPSIAGYHKHRLVKHKGERLPRQGQTRICEICGVSLKLTSMPNHLKTHSQEKQFKCATCNMRFTTKVSMERHQVTHTGEKPFKCTLCDKRFTQKASASLHYRTFHLKEPYPKRNRSKKTVIQPDSELLEKILMKI